MYRLNFGTTTFAYPVIDAGVAVAALILALILVNVPAGAMPLDQFLEIRITLKNVLALLGITLAWPLLFSLFGLYRSHELRPLSVEWKRVLRACSFGTAFAVLLALASQSRAFGAQSVVLFWLTVTVGTLAVRALGRKMARGAAPYYVLIVGTGPRARRLFHELRDSRAATVLGFVDTVPAAVPAGASAPFLGTIDELEHILATRAVDAVHIGLPVRSCYAAIEQVIRICDRIGVASSHPGDVFPRSRLRPQTGGVGMVVERQVAAADYRLWTKRLLDIAGATVGLVVLSPIMLAAAVAVKATSPGPAFFTLVRNARANMVVSPEPNANPSLYGVNEAELNSEIELINTRDLLEEVAKQTLLAPGEVSSKDKVERALRQMDRSLRVAALRKTNIISVSYSDPSPERAVRVLSLLSSLYLDKHLSAHHTAGAYQFFLSQADHYQNELTQAQQRLSDFRKRLLVPALPMQKDLMVRESATFESQLNDLDARIREVQERIARTRGAAGAMAPTVVTATRSIPNQYSIERLTTMLVELKNRRIELASKFAPGDRLIQDVDQQIQDTQAKLDAVEQLPAVESTEAPSPIRETLLTALAQAEIELAGLEARREGLLGQQAVLKQDMRSLEASTPEHEALERDLKAAEANFLLYQNKREEARIADALDRDKISNVSVAQAPTVPSLPSSPNRPMLAAAGLLLAFFVALGGMMTADLFFPGGQHEGAGRALPAADETPALATDATWAANALSPPARWSRRSVDRTNRIS